MNVFAMGFGRIGSRQARTRVLKKFSLVAQHWSEHLHVQARCMGSACVLRAGERVSRSRTLKLPHIEPLDFRRKFVSARRRNQHARCVRYPDSVNALLSFQGEVEKSLTVS